MHRFGLIALVCAAAPAFAAGKLADLEKCYQPHGQLETVKKGGKEVTTYKDSAQVALECNEKVVARAKKEKDVAVLKDLAGIIGRNWNWSSALPVYMVAVKKDASKAFCVHEDPIYALFQAIGHPADHKHTKAAREYMAACWPQLKDKLVAKAAEESSGYSKDNVCAFLKEKQALPPENTCVTSSN